MADQTRSFSSTAGDHYRPDATNSIQYAERLASIDSSYAVWPSSNTYYSRGESHNFGFSVPGGATIDGVAVEIYHKDEYGDGESAAKVWLSFDGGEENSGSFEATTYTASTSSASFETDTVGGPTAKWGAGSISASDINSS